MELLRLSVQRETLISKAMLAQNMHQSVVAARWNPDALEKAIPVRNQTDSIRVALAHKARAWAKFEQDGQECKAVVDATKGAKGLDLRIHVRRKDAQQVSYSDLVLSITGGAGEPVRADVTPIGQTQYPDLVADLGNLEALQAFGEAHLFDNDLRRLAQDLLARVTMPLWPGVALVLDPAAQSAISALQALYAHLTQGAVVCRLLSLDNTPANKIALAEELAERLTTEGAEILEMLGYPDPNQKRIQKLYDALVERVRNAEALLEVEIPCWDVLADIEMGLELLQESAV